MTVFVRTNSSKHLLPRHGKMLVVLLLIFSPFTAVATLGQSSIYGKQTTSPVGEATVQYEPASYQVTSTSSFSFSSSYNPAQTVYKPFSSEAPNDSQGGPSKVSSRKNSGEYDWTITPDDPGERTPIGDAWPLLVFAVISATFIYIKRRRTSKANA
ncbi:MAG: hypothetical protein J6R26_02005 [Paludibacteraceae bacterium]|nr:hypothetical protein [Paludibacteraceae bacterium]